jgi:hypothetical protein
MTSLQKIGVVLRLVLIFPSAFLVACASDPTESPSTYIYKGAEYETYADYLNAITVYNQSRSDQFKAAAQHREVQAAQQRESEEIDARKRRLSACDSFGFERGTEAHAECAMKLYMNEQNQDVANAITSSNNQQTAALARQQAVQEATLKEQKRIRELEAALRGVQIGIGIMNGTTSSSNSAPTTQTHTYTINGQIINCTTTGSVTNCF